MSCTLHPKVAIFPTNTSAVPIPIQLYQRGRGQGRTGKRGGTGGAVPGREGRHGFEAVRVADHLVQRVDDLAELGPVVAVLLPAVQHELVQSAWAVHGWWQPIVLLYGIDYLGTTQGPGGAGWVR